MAYWIDMVTILWQNSWSPLAGVRAGVVILMGLSFGLLTVGYVEHFDIGIYSIELTETGFST